MTDRKTFSALSVERNSPACLTPGPILYSFVRKSAKRLCTAGSQRTLSGSESKLAVVITSAGFTDHCWRLVQVASHGVVDQVEISAGEVFVPFRGLRVPEMSVMRASGAREQPIALVGAIRRPAPAHVTSMEELRKRGAENRD